MVGARGNRLLKLREHTLDVIPPGAFGGNAHEIKVLQDYLRGKGLSAVRTTAALAGWLARRVGRGAHARARHSSPRRTGAS